MLEYSRPIYSVIALWEPDMQENNRKRGVNWGSAIGWLIFILVIVGARLPGLLNNLSGGAITLPSNLLPMLIGGLVVLSILVAAVRSLGGSRRGQADTRLPTGSTPMPPFGGPIDTWTPPSTSLPRSYTVPRADQSLPSAPRFEPVINPKILVLGIVGALLLAGAALLFSSFVLP
jgi:hypothetical protein